MQVGWDWAKPCCYCSCIWTPSTSLLAQTWGERSQGNLPIPRPTGVLAWALLAWITGTHDFEFASVTSLCWGIPAGASWGLDEREARPQCRLPPEVLTQQL